MGQYQLIELQLTNDHKVLAITAPFLNEEQAKAVHVKKFIVYPPQVIPRTAQMIFNGLFDILRGVVNERPPV